MKLSEIKKLFDRSLDPWLSSEEIPGQLEKEGFSPDFSKDFNSRITERLGRTPVTLSLQTEFVSTLSYVFNRVALTGVAAILILLLSIFLTQGSLSLDSFLGISDSSEESMVFLLTGI